MCAALPLYPLLARGYQVDGDTFNVLAGHHNPNTPRGRLVALCAHFEFRFHGQDQACLTGSKFKLGRRIGFDCESSFRVGLLSESGRRAAKYHGNAKFGNGLFGGRVENYTANTRTAHEYEVNVLRPLEVSEKSVYFGAVKPGAAAVRAIRLTSPYDKPITLTGVENSREESFTWRTDDSRPHSGSSLPIIVSATGAVPEGTTSGVLKGTLVFHATVGEEVHHARVEAYALIE